MLNVKLVEHQGKYLGMPMWLGKSKSRDFAPLKDRIWKKIKGWKQQLFLSFAGREALLKAVVQETPTYIMSLFKLPIGFCHDLQRMMVRFWWGCKDGERRIHWVAWNSLCNSKDNGGLGFRRLMEFNEAMLAKQCWRLMHNTSLLATQILKARYLPHSEFLEST